MSKVARALEAPTSATNSGWDFQVSGERLYYRSRTQPLTVPFAWVQLPAKAQKLAAANGKVYVWLNAATGGSAQLLGYTASDKGPVSPITLALDDPGATAALKLPFAPATTGGVHPASAGSSDGVAAISPQRLFVANYGADSVTAINTSNYSVIGTVALTTGASPYDVAASPNNFQAFTANSSINCTTCTNGYLGVSIFDPVGLDVIGFLSSQYPTALALSPDGSSIYVGDFLNLETFNTSSGAQAATAGLPSPVQAIAATSDGLYVLAASSYDSYYSDGYNGAANDDVSIMAAGGTSVTSTTLTPGADCWSVAVQPGNAQVAVSCNFDYAGTTPEVIIFSLSGGVITQTSAFYTTTTYSVTWSPDGSKLYITHSGTNSVDVVNPSTGVIINTFSVGTTPINMITNKAGTIGYVANDGSNSVTVLDLVGNAVLSTVSTGANPGGLALTVSAPVLSSTPGSLSFTSGAGTSPSAQTITFNADQPSGLSWSASTTTNSGGNWLSLSSSTGIFPQVVQVSVNSSGLSVGTYTGAINASAAGAGNSLSINVTLTVTAAVTLPPLGAVLNGASFSAAAVAPGELVSIFGSNMGPTTGVGNSILPVPTTLSGVQVMMGGYSAPLLYVSSTQINCQVPFELNGQSTMQVSVINGANATPSTAIPLTTSSPGLFSGTIGTNTLGAILNASYSQITPSNPAKAGDTIQIYATGQGIVLNQPADGAAPAGSTSYTPATPVVLIGGSVAGVAFSGLAPCCAGLWQVNAVVPNITVPSNGLTTVQVILNNQVSNQVNLAVH